MDEGDSCSEQLLVTELLAEQVEAADTLLINKCDLVDEKGKSTVEDMVKGLNSNAKVFKSEFGNAPVVEILKRAVEEKEMEKEGGCCSNPDCGSKKAAAEAKKKEEEEAVMDHSHEHSHDHGKEAAHGADLAGITSFTYKSDRPFNMERLLDVLNAWPVPTKDTLDLEAMATYRDSTAVMPDGKKVDNPFVSILRSKGFIWLAPTDWKGENGDAWRHETAMYWSHAGKHFGINQAGKWWGTIGKDEVREFLKGREGEADRIFQEDWLNDEFGDRRQEIVFIGVNYDEEKIRASLDLCLLGDQEMDEYREQSKWKVGAADV